jgi:hypothetical protein
MSGVTVVKRVVNPECNETVTEAVTHCHGRHQNFMVGDILRLHTVQNPLQRLQPLRNAEACDFWGKVVALDPDRDMTLIVPLSDDKFPDVPNHPIREARLGEVYMLLGLSLSSNGPDNLNSWFIPRSGHISEIIPVFDLFSNMRN